MYVPIDSEDGSAEVRQFFSIDRLAAANSSLLPYPATPITFKTFPDSRIPGTKFKFIASSCIVRFLHCCFFCFLLTSCSLQLPNFPYKPFTASNRIEAFNLLHAQLTAPPPTVPPFVEDFDLAEDGEPVVAQPQTAQSPIVPEYGDVPAETTPAPAPVPEASPIVPGPELSTSTVVVKPKETSAVVDTEFLLLLGGRCRKRAVKQVTEPCSYTLHSMNLDFIYSDVPKKSADDKEEFLQAYRHTYASKEFRKVYERLRKSRQY